MLDAHRLHADRSRDSGEVDHPEHRLVVTHADHVEVVTLGPVRAVVEDDDDERDCAALGGLARPA